MSRDKPARLPQDKHRYRDGRTLRKAASGGLQEETRNLKKLLAESMLGVPTLKKML